MADAEGEGKQSKPATKAERALVRQVNAEPETETETGLTTRSEALH